MKNMYIVLILTVALLLTLLYGCNDSVKPSNTKILDSVVVITDTIMPDIQCLEWNLVENRLGDQYIIRNESDYQKLKNLKDNGFGCPNWDFPVIDFSKKTLLGRLIRGGGIYPGPIFNRTIKKYNYLKKYLYTIDVIEYHHRQIVIGRGHVSYNWIIVNDIPQDYNVEIDTTYLKIFVD